MSKVFIARDNMTGLHVLFEVVPSDRQGVPREPPSLAFLNSFVKWGSLPEAVKLLEESGPMVYSDVLRKENRSIGIDEVLDVAGSGGVGGRYVAPDETVLQAELYLEGMYGAYPSKASTRRAARELCLFGREAVEALLSWRAADASCRVAVEPLRDVVLVRNHSQLALRMLAHLAEPGDDVLTRSGFREVELVSSRDNPQPKGRRFAIPFQHDVHWNGSLAYTAGEFKKIANIDRAAPLGHAIRRLAQHGPLNVVKGFPYGSVSSAWLAWAPAVTGEWVERNSLGADYDLVDTRYYLTLDASGGTQREVATTYLRSLFEMFRDLRGEGGDPLGWQGEIEARLEGTAEARAYSVAGAILRSVLYRTGMAASTCKFCGDGMFVNPKARPKEYCSSTCRSKSSVVARGGLQ